MNNNDKYILGTKISSHTKYEILKEIQLTIENGNKIKILSGNIHSINMAMKYDWFKKFMNSSEIVRNDSEGIKIAGKLIGLKIPERNTWADFGWTLAEFCENKFFSLFFLGDKPGISELAKNKLLEKFPNLKIVGAHHGYFNKENEENEKIIKLINKVKPNILIIGMGMPLQEEWLKNNFYKLNINVAMTGGNCFSYLSGVEKRAPTFMRMNGLEWLFRLMIEPKRLFKRYFIGNPLFFYRIFLQKLGIKNFN